MDNLQQNEGERDVERKTVGQDMQAEKGITSGYAADIGLFGQLKWHVPEPSVCVCLQQANFFLNHCPCLRVAQCMCKSLNPCVIMALGILYISRACVPMLRINAYSFQPAAGGHARPDEAWGGHSPPSASVYQVLVSRYRVTFNPLTSLTEYMSFPPLSLAS